MTRTLTRSAHAQGLGELIAPGEFGRRRRLIETFIAEQTEMDNTESLIRAQSEPPITQTTDSVPVQTPVPASRISNLPSNVLSSTPMTRAQTLGNLHQGTRNTNIQRQGTFKIPNTILRRSKLRHRMSDAASIYRKKRSEVRNNFDEPQTLAQLGELFANVDFQKALSKEIVDRVARDKKRAAGNNDDTSSTTGSTTGSISVKSKNKPRSSQIPNI
jgi:hypothetical protein